MANPILLVTNFDGSLSGQDPDGAVTWSIAAGDAEYTGGSPAQLQLDQSDGDSITITQTGHIDALQGSMLFWMQRLVDTGSDETFLEVGVSDPSEDHLFVSILTDKLVIGWDSRANLPVSIESADTIATSTNYLVYFEWTQTSQRLIIDQGAPVEQLRDIPTGTLSTDINLEATGTGASFAIGPFLIASRPLTNDEITILAPLSDWEYADLDPQSDQRAVGAGNGQTIDFELYLADTNNAQTTNLSSAFYGTSAQIDLNHDREIKTLANLPIKDPTLLEPYRSFVAVYLNRAYDDGRTADRDQLGLFGVRVPPGTRTIERADAIYTGQDLTATLARYAFTDAYNIAASSNYVTAVTDILALASLTRTLIEPTTQTTAAIISFPIGTSYLKACNSLLESIGYYNLACLPDGRLFSMPTRPLQYVEPYRTITDADLMKPVDVQPLDTTVANIVIVVKDNPNAAPLTATRSNTAADSPTSTVNLGPITRVEPRGDLADQAAADALADRLLSEGRSFYQTAKLTILPDPRVLIPHQTIELNLTGKLAILNGRWWMRTARVPLNTKATEVEINRVTDTIQGTLI